MDTRGEACRSVHSACCACSQVTDSAALGSLALDGNALGDEGEAAIQEAVRSKEGFKLKINTA